MKPFKDLKDLADRPETMTGPGLTDTRGSQLDELCDDYVVPAYKVPWESYGHLKNADADITDAVWGVQDGARDVRQLKSIKEMK